MKRWPVWTCGGIVALGLLARLLLGGSAPKAGSEEPPRSASVSPVTSTPAAGSSSSGGYSATTLGRLQLDHLPPPPADASPEEKAEYERALREIQDGNDPVLKASLKQVEKNEATKKRMLERQEAARARVVEMRNQFQPAINASKQNLRNRLIGAGQNPDAPPPPLFPTPKLGDAVVERKTEPEKK